MVKRKWWASESYNGYHKQIFDVDDTRANWKWLDEKWVSIQEDVYFFVSILLRSISNTLSC